MTALSSESAEWLCLLIFPIISITDVIMPMLIMAYKAAGHKAKTTFLGSSKINSCVCLNCCEKHIVWKKVKGNHGVFLLADKLLTVLPVQHRLAPVCFFLPCTPPLWKPWLSDKHWSHITNRGKSKMADLALALQHGVLPRLAPHPDTAFFSQPKIQSCGEQFFNFFRVG